MRARETAFDYSREGLAQSELNPDPISQFHSWYEEAIEDGVLTPNAMSLATSSAQAVPTVRTVLLKFYDQGGFVYFTNYNSLKGAQLAENPRAALLFPWVSSGRQVNIRGRVERLSKFESEEYFLSRPRGSQLGAWSSNQSVEVDSREVLEQELVDIEQRFDGTDVPLPPFWGGFRVIPTVFEFWQARQGRLHDRFQYHLNETSWRIVRVSP